MNTPSPNSSSDAVSEVTPNRGIIAWWVSNPIAANLMMILLCVTGVVTFNSFVEKEPFPNVEFPMMEVRINWRGAAPREIEDQILTRIENAVSDIEGVRNVRSHAWEGGGRVYVRGKERINTSKFADEVREKVDGVNGLPSDLDRIMVRELSNRRPMIRIALHGSQDPAVMSELALDLRRELSALPLISSVDIQGNQREEISIEVTEESLRKYNIDFDEISSAIKNHSVNLSGGTIRSETGSVQLSVRSRAEDKIAFEDIIIRRTDDGAILKLQDVAKVLVEYDDHWRVSSFDGENAVLLKVMNGDYMDIPRMSKAVHAYVDDRQKTLPTGLKLTVWDDWNDAYSDRLSMLFWNAVTGLILVILLLVFFLQPKVALWVAVGIATALSATFVFMPVLDISLTMISLFSLLMVIGIVVDDAIVIGESIHRAHERGLDGDNAAIQGTQEVARPVIFGVLTTMIAFLPMAFLPGVTSEFTRVISFVVCLALSFSLFEALCILPSHLRHLPHPGDKRNTRFTVFQQRISLGFEHLIQKYYGPCIQWSLNHVMTVILAFLGIFMVGASILSMGYVEERFTPEVTGDNIEVKVVLPNMTSTTRMAQVLAQVNNGVEQLRTHVNGLSESGDTGMIEHFYSELRDTRIETNVKLVPVKQRIMSIEEAADLLREYIDDIPDAEEIEFSSTLNEVDPKLGFNISAHSNKALQAGVSDLKAHLATYEGVYLIRDNTDKGGIEYVFELKPGAEAMGVNLRLISQQIRQAYFGQEVERLPREGGDSYIRLRYSRAERESLETLENMRVRTKDGREIPLFAVVDIHTEPAMQRVDREDGKKVGRIRAEYAGTNIKEIRDKINKEFVPGWKERNPEAEWGLGKGGRDRREFMHALIRLEAIALLAAYMLMAIAFRSYLQPLLLMSAIPFAFAGGIMGHLIHNSPFGIFSMMGFLAAAGVVINDNLVLVDCINRLRRNGLNAFDAAKQACLLRFRPIFLTSLTTFVGLSPMLAADSVQAKFLIPMVVSLAYGVLSATVTTLLFVPALYVMSVRIADFFKAVYGAPSKVKSAQTLSTTDTP